jgi:3-oxoadipate enol-lactonase
MTVGLLLLHAFPLSEDMWRPQTDALTGQMPVITVDLPGFGGAPVAEPEGWMDHAADDAAAALGGTGIDRVVVCGLSMGGYVAFSFWRRHRNLTAGLILANTRADADDDAAKQRRRDLAERLRREGSDFLVESPPPLLSERAPAEVWEQVKALMRRQPAESIARASLAVAHRVDSRSDLATIDVPTLAITSSADTLIPPDVTKEMASQIPGARLEVIDGAGHLSNLEAPEQFNRLIAEHAKLCGVSHDASGSPSQH